MKLRLSENFRAVFYAPFYAMKALGMAEREGLDLAWQSSEHPGGGIEAVKSGAIELTWGGPMRVIKDHDSTPAGDASLVCFGEVVGRDPFYLIGRADYSLRDLPGLRLGVVSEVPTPWLCLQADLRDAGIAQPAGGQLVDGLTMAQQVQVLQRGELDVVQVFEPYVSQALAAGGRVLYAAAQRGPTAYTTFICSRAGLARHGEAFSALSRALAALQQWIADCDAVEFARIVSPFFPDVPAQGLSAAVERYRGSGVWSRHPGVSRAGFDRLAYSLHVSGFASSQMHYDDCVHNFDA